MRRNYLKPLKKMAMIVIACIVAGYLLLSLVYALPSSSITNHCYESALVLSKEAYILVEAKSDRVLDNFTDSLMLLQAGYSGDENVFDKAAKNYYMQIGEETPYDTLLQEYLYGNDTGEVLTYSRYWHGYLLFLRPLLTVCNYGQIRIINGFALSILCLCVLILLVRKIPKCIIPFILCIFLIAPTAVQKSLQFSSVCYITLVGCILFLWNPKQMFEGDKVRYLFLGMGIATSFFDLLTAPTITLTILLAILILQRKDEKNKLKLILECVFCWGFGYVFMWAGKWLIAFAAERQVFIEIFISGIKVRFSKTSLSNESVTRIGTLRLNFETLFADFHINIALFGYTLIVVINDVLHRFRITAEKLNTCILLYIPVLLPIIWILLLTNHSNIHFWYTYRTLVPCIFSLLCALDLVDSRA